MSDILALIKASLPFDASHTYAVTGLVSVMCVGIYYLNSLFALRNTTTIPKGQHYLLVIAHPDDECMFFSPTIVNLTSNNNRVSVLCLSNGDAEGLGKVREKELIKSCTLLGCKSEDVSVINHEELQDTMAMSWDSKIIVKELSRFFKSKKDVTYDAFITFDEFGVSLHPNHTSILPALKAYTASSSIPKSQPKPIIWKLITTSLPRKYSGILDAMPSLVLVTYRVARAPGRGSKKKDKFMCFMSDPLQSFKGQRAMVTAHVSQMRWFRWFWIVIGRYMYINELAKEP